MPFPRGLLYFPGPRSIVWGSRGCFPVLGARARFQGGRVVSAQPGSGQDRRTTHGRWLWVPLGGGFSWGPGGGSSLDCSLERKPECFS